MRFFSLVLLAFSMSFLMACEEVDDPDGGTIGDGNDTESRQDTSSGGRNAEETCEYNGTVYESGEGFPSSDGCNSCSCEVSPDGTEMIACTTMACIDPCAMQDETGCNEDPACTPIMGRPLDMTLQCIGDRAFAGCMSADMGCGDAETTAMGPDGTCWWFSSTCTGAPDYSSNKLMIPEGDPMPGAPVFMCDPASDWPLCNP